MAVTSARQYNELDDVIAAKRGQYSLLVVLDGIEDPHNLGAILRTADAAGADGVVIPERRAVGVTATVTKASAGASEHLAHRQGHEYRAHGRRVEGEKYLGGRRSMSAARSLRLARLQHGLRRRARGEGKGVHDLVRGNVISWCRSRCWARCRR